MHTLPVETLASLGMAPTSSACALAMTADNGRRPNKKAGQPVGTDQPAKMLF